MGAAGGTMRVLLLGLLLVALAAVHAAPVYDDPIDDQMAILSRLGDDDDAAALDGSDSEDDVEHDSQDSEGNQALSHRQAVAKFDKILKREEKETHKEIKHDKVVEERDQYEVHKEDSSQDTGTQETHLKDRQSPH